MSETTRRASRLLVEAVKLMRAKDHDYGEAWKDLSIGSHLDRVKVKTIRMTRLLELRAKGVEALVSEGVKAEALDVINYCLFILMAMEDQEHEQALEGDQGSAGRSGSGEATPTNTSVADGARAHAQAE